MQIRQLPSRDTPGHWKLLPTNCGKKKVYLHYCDVSDAAGTRTMAVQTFCRLWQQLLPFVVTMRLATATATAGVVKRG